MSVAAIQPNVPVPAPASRPPLRGWAQEFVRRWNGGTYSLFILHGNIFDLFPIGDGAETMFAPLKAFLARRLFPDRECLLFYDVSDGLTFGTPEMQTKFFSWLEGYDEVEKTNYHSAGVPRDFVGLAPILRRFFRAVGDERKEWRGVTLVIDYPEKLIPATDGAGSGMDERMNVVTFQKWAAAEEMARLDVGIILITESAAKLNEELLQNPYVAQIRIELPDEQDRLRFLRSRTIAVIGGGKPLGDWCDFTAEQLAVRTSGLNVLRIRHFLSESANNGVRVTADSLAASKQRLIEEYCQGLVRFKEPRPDRNLDAVATHTAAKQKLRQIAWLIRNGKTDVVEKGILIPGRVGSGKSYLIDCFASECGLPVMEIGDFRSKWVGDTERQQTRILLTIRALGPVIVVVDEADAVFGGREGEGDSGVSSRVFAGFAAHIASSPRGRELWIAMTSRPDRLAIDMKRQGRFGLCIPLFAAQGPADVIDLFQTVARVNKLALTDEMVTYVRQNLGELPLTGSDVESIVVRARENATTDSRELDVRASDIEAAVSSFIDPLDPEMLELQELAAVLACSDRRFLPPRFSEADRAQLRARFTQLKVLLRA